MTGSANVTTSTWSVVGLGSSLLLIVLWSWACTGGASDDDDGPTMGAEGGICRLDETCNAGLECVSGRCVDLSAPDVGTDASTDVVDPDAGDDADAPDTQTDPATSDDGGADTDEDDVPDAASDPFETCAFYFNDADGDGAGGGAPIWVCAPNPAPPGWVQDDSDCDDTDPNVGPDVERDRGDGLDNDCDSEVDEDTCAWEPLIEPPGDFSGDGVGVGDTWPALRFEDQCGGTSTALDLYGAPIIVMVSATWCSPCNLAAEELSALQADAMARVGTYFHFVTIQIDGPQIGVAATAADAEAWAEAYDLMSPVWFAGETDELFRLAQSGFGGIAALPSIWFLGPDLEVERFTEGFPGVTAVESWLRGDE